jgi:YD repeat-containing protein
VITCTDADGSAEQFSYDAQGNKLESINRRGQAIRYTYDSRGLVTRREHADGAHEDFTYDARGNLLTATDSQGTTTWEHDPADRLTKVAYPSGRFLQFSYDAGGRRTRMVDQAGFAVNYLYDAAGRLERQTDGTDQLVVGYTYDLTGRLSRKDLGNGTFATYEYDAAGQLLHLVNHAPDGSSNSRFDYTYDDAGRRTSMTTQEGTFTFAGQFGVMQEGNGLDFMRARYYSDEDAASAGPDRVPGRRCQPLSLCRELARQLG